MVIKSYVDFINESYKLILESDVVYSDRMKLALASVDDPLAEYILSIENQDLPVKSNFFDLKKDSNDKISFIPDRKAQEILADSTEYVNFIGRSGGWLRHTDSNKNIFNELGYTYEDGEEPFNPTDNALIGEIISKFTSRTSGKTYAYVKFREPGKREVIGEGVYNTQKLRKVDNRQKLVWSKNRQEIKVGKGIRALLASSDFNFTDQDLENFVNKFKAVVDKLNDKFSYFEIVSGDEIVHWYDGDNYRYSLGTLGSSCMSDVDGEFFDIYVKNPDVCELVILKSEDQNDKIAGRALLWTLVSGKKFLDRVYTRYDSDTELFREFALENGWYVKFINSSRADNSSLNKKEGKVRIAEEEFKIQLESGEYDSYPYLDTFKYYNPGTGILSAFEKAGSYLLEDTGGEHIVCEYCNGSGETTCYDCSGDGDITCSECYGDGEVECSNCGGDGEEYCSYCEGEGEVDGEDCKICNGSGEVECTTCNGSRTEECWECSGDGTYTCSSCEGYGVTECEEC